MHCNAVLVSLITLHGIRIIKTGVNDKLDVMCQEGAVAYIVSFFPGIRHVSFFQSNLIRSLCKTRIEQIFGILLTVRLSIFLSVFNQPDAQNLFHNTFYFMPLHVSSTSTHHQEVKIALHKLWYHHTYRCDDTRGCVMQF